MPLDPRNHKDWEIAEEAEGRMKTVFELAEVLGLQKEELIPMGHYLGKIDFAAAFDLPPRPSEQNCADTSRHGRRHPPQ